MHADWTITDKGNKTTYSREFPQGKVTVKHKQLSSGFSAWFVQFPDGKQFRTQNWMDACDYADRYMEPKTTSILSAMVDGMNCYYGWLGDRRIDVMRNEWLSSPVDFRAYVDGEPIPGGALFATKDEAEAAAIKWAQENKEK